MADKFAIAIDIGGSSTKIALVGHDGSTGPVSSLPTAGPLPSFLDALARHVAPMEDYPAGVSVAGFVDGARSSMVYNPNLPWLEHVPLRAEIAARTAHDVRAFDADSNAAAYAEFAAGAGAGSKRFLCLSIGTGVGGGMLVDGEILRVAHGGVGDIGHVIVDPTGLRCTAGCRGCAEAMIAAPAIEARWPGPGRPATREIIDLARGGDELARAHLAETGRLLGVALATYAAVVFPDTIAIAGGVSEADELLLQPARESLNSLTGPFYRCGLRVVKARHGWQAPLLGAGLMALSAAGR